MSSLAIQAFGGTPLEAFADIGSTMFVELALHVGSPACSNLSGAGDRPDASPTSRLP
jgi:hypothetical protein